MAAIRGLKNVVGNYSSGEVKVREATTNEPWGPTTAQLAEISDLCYQLLHFHEVMSMIEKRLNDKGKNYRHVAKGLLVLDYVIKTGPDRVIQYWKDKLYIINTLKDFQFTDKDLKDQGRMIRDRAKQITVLLNDNDALLLEREKALETKKKFHSGNLVPTSSTDTVSRSWEPERKAFHAPDSKGGSQPGSTPNLSADIKAALPTNRGEEDLQLQLALALSKQDENKSTKISFDEDNEYKKVIQLSKDPTELSPGLIAPPPSTKHADPWVSLPEPSQPVLRTDPGDPWGGPGSTQAPQAPQTTQELLFGDQPDLSDPWEGELRGRLDSPAPTTSDPWGELTSAPTGSPALKPVNLTNEIVMGPDPWAESNKGSDVTDPLPLLDAPISSPKHPMGPHTVAQSKLMAANTIEEGFLGSSHAKLVNLDALVDLGRAPTPGSSQVGNPFAMLPPETASAPAINPFAGHEAPQPTLNQMRDFSKPDPLQAPLIPSSGLPPPSQTSHASELASIFEAPPVSNPLPNYNIPNLSGFPQTGPPVQTGYSGLGQTGPPVQTGFSGLGQTGPPVQTGFSGFPQTGPAVQTGFSGLGQTGPPVQTGFSGLGQLSNQGFTGYPAGPGQNFSTAAYPPQMGLAPNQSAAGFSGFGTGQISTGPPDYSAFQSGPPTVPTGPTAGVSSGVGAHNYGGAPSFPQSSNPFF